MRKQIAISLDDANARLLLALVPPLATFILNGSPAFALDAKQTYQKDAPSLVAASNAAMAAPPLKKMDNDQSSPQSKNNESSPAAPAPQETQAPATHPGSADIAAEKPTIVGSEAPAIAWIDHSRKPKAAILCIHGLSLHKGTFDALGKRLARDGYAVYAIDVRGFGDWVSQNRKCKVDLEGSLKDIEKELQDIHKAYPDLPVVILGESMGGAIALHATSLYPNLISGLVSCVPAGDRFGASDEDFKVGIHALLGGFNKEMNIGRDVVEQATKKEDLRNAWGNDPLVRMKLSPNELLQFSEFMGKNPNFAKNITATPVLFIQGANDKLVRPAGTWRLCEALGTADRQIVFSKSAEHLILEEAQFSDEDIGFIENWLKRHVLAQGNTTESTTAQEQSAPPTKKEDVTVEKQNATSMLPVPPVPLEKKTGPPANTASGKKTNISYWIELYRNGKVYRCNNKYPFRSGDSIRFHVMSENDGYAYIVMKQGTSGKQAVLFPDARTGMANDIAHGQDYPLPSKAWLTFDRNPGIEKVSIIFSTKPLDGLMTPKQPKYVTAYVSPDKSGSKDLVPARMQLSWQDPDPVIIPQMTSLASASASANQNSIVMVSCQDPSAVLSLDIALAHN